MHSATASCSPKAAQPSCSNVLSPGVAPQPGEIELLDTATAAEGYDLVRTDPQMPGLRHVAEKLFRDRPIDVIHPHAPGTMDHDPSELTAYRDVAGPPDRPIFMRARARLATASARRGWCRW